MSGPPQGVDRLLALDEIRELALRYASALHDGDVEAMVELFVPDARFGPYGSGPDALRAITSEAIEGSRFIVLLVTNHLVDLVSAEEARGEVWSLCFTHNVGLDYVEQVVKYEDRYAKVGGSWRFVHRRHRLLFGRSPQPSPFSQDPANWPRKQIGVGDLALESEAFRSWYETTRTQGYEA